ncbi:hypothetical protein DOROTHY_98 [Mycobacterium phage Dorothy]|nr:hypothetical protein PBI_TWEETY_98 [Mycobacterium phage Tweety]YP_009125376.1 hypothetical protein VC69_gp095 [Mycobacterium phage Inventum]YP_009592073.1 hypothetical protein FDG65_gp098 [Mycobacterium phage Dorothy]YP_009955003.1 hypothetical protein I5H17_gp107 [Mycobacterium phage BodEinwohner17]YP_009956765.1 hypothetical protein I5H34_gp097 [Mycobacterium phage Empress]YP_009958337.1 hypothetical protein I5H49_gp100 [Mycobacterium phage JoeyJr]YP_009961399.1 hypothetical protein I5H7
MRRAARRLIATSRRLDPPKDETRLYAGNITPEPWEHLDLYRPPSLLTRIWWCIRG